MLISKLVNEVATMHDISEGAPNRTLLSAFLIMGTNRFRRLPITKIGKIYGILTASDMLRAVAEKGLPAAYKERIDSYMTPQPVTVNAEQSIQTALHIMHTRHFGSLIVTGTVPDRIQGILTERDILRLAADFPWNDMTVADLRDDFIKDHLLELDEHTPLLTAVSAMAKHDDYWIVVENEKKELSGLVTANDIIHFFSKERDEIHDNPNFLANINLRFLAQKSCATATKQTPIQEVMEKMLEKHVGGIPIVENNEVVGIFTERDLISYFTTLFE